VEGSGTTSIVPEFSASIVWPVRAGQVICRYHRGVPTQ
jgi:hypothetical protein